ncbi:DNA topoisomerase i, putative [Theileria annulata]|uniref:DNA topoisomerase 1 n=1 Tax=Theileria annulata TaxID=5874 RepID=Q4UDP8_THEAN|nr:DNA topoisomerase i, putative [Theileria annulata]CAI74791.1 DNA topoisomerase i, putative [Theileria annulata]|eukprot:XP_952523.1 DNA topoisomerase i, putative [Theileria annulata]
MDSQLWVPVPKIKATKSEPESSKDPLERVKTDVSGQNKTYALNLNKHCPEKNNLVNHGVGLSGAPDNSEDFTLSVRINRKRTLNDLFDESDDENFTPNSEQISSKTHLHPVNSSGDLVNSKPLNNSEIKADKLLPENVTSGYQKSSDVKVNNLPLKETVNNLEKGDHKRQKTDSSDDFKRSDSGEVPLSNELESLTDSIRKSLDAPKPVSSTTNLNSNTLDHAKTNKNNVNSGENHTSKNKQMKPKTDHKTKSDRKTKNEDVSLNHIKTENLNVKTEVKIDMVKDVKVEEKVQIKKEKKVDPLVIEDIIEPINRWWEEIDEDMDYNKGLEFESKSSRWKYLEHNGMIFTPEYVPHNIPIMVKGETIHLPPNLEEIATMWAQSMGTNYETSEIYCKNFWQVFVSKFEKDHFIRRCKLSDADFSLIKNHLEEEKQKKKDNKEFYKAKQQEDAKREYRFNYALVDWVREKVSSNKLEPPGLFKGRGLHPKQGLLKSRMFPKDVILNLSKDAPVPKVTNFQREGHSWKDIYHDNSVTWLAYYKDSINDQFKYMYLSAQSKFKGFHDFLKYNKARELKAYIQKIRDDYNTKMLCMTIIYTITLDIYEKQLGTAVYLIDYLALRVGGEKDADEADTVGCCSLRVEHIKFSEKKKNTITLDFLGKDSIRYFNTLNDVAYDNLAKFCNRKKSSEGIFSKINTNKLNEYLRELMDGLSAKVFRTYNASITLQNQFKRLRSKYKRSISTHTLLPSSVTDGLNDLNGLSVNEETGRTSRSSSNTDYSSLTSTNSIDINSIDDLDDTQDEINDKPTNNENSTKDKNKDKDKDTKDVSVDIGNVSELLQFYNYANREVAILCNHQRSIPKQHETSMTKLKLQAKMLKEDIQELNEYCKHLQSNSKDEFKFESKTKDVNGNPRKLITKPGMKLEAAKNKLATLKKKQKDHNIKMTIKDSNKTVALGTSKINYMDPRITVAFCKKYEIPIEKVFNKSLRMKFPWAMCVRSDFTF